MTFETLSAVVDALRPRLRAEFHVAALYVFGSVARGDTSDDSDVDLLVDFDGSATFVGFMDLKAALEDALVGVRVDLATRAMLTPPLRARVDADLRRLL